MPLEPDTPTDTDLVQGASDRPTPSGNNPAEFSLSSSSNLQSCISAPLSPRRAASGTSDRRVRFPDNPTTEITYYYVDPSDCFRSSHVTDYDSAESSEDDTHVLRTVAQSTGDDGVDSDDGYGDNQQLSQSNWATPLLVLPSLSAAPPLRSTDHQASSPIAETLDLDSSSTGKDLKYEYPISHYPEMAQERTQFKPGHRRSRISVSDFAVSPEIFPSPSDSRVSPHSSSSTRDSVTETRSLTTSRHSPNVAPIPVSSSNSSANSSASADRTLSARQQEKQPARNEPKPTTSATLPSPSSTRSSSRPKPSTPLPFASPPTYSLPPLPPPLTCPQEETSLSGGLPLSTLPSPPVIRSPLLYMPVHLTSRLVSTATQDPARTIRQPAPTTLHMMSFAKASEAVLTPELATTITTSSRLSSRSCTQRPRLSSESTPSSLSPTSSNPSISRTYTHALRPQRHLPIILPQEASPHLIPQSDEFLEAVLAASDVPVNQASLSTTMPSSLLATGPLDAASSSEIVRNDLHTGIVEIEDGQGPDLGSGSKPGSRVDESPPTRRSFRQRLKDKFSIFKSRKKTTKVEGGC